MEAAVNNVVKLGEYGQDKAGAMPSGKPLNDCREKSTLGLCRALTDSLAKIRTDLEEGARKTADTAMFRFYMDAADLVRLQGSQIVEDFRTHYLRRFNQECRREKPTADLGGGLGELSLMDPDDLELTLAADTLANALLNACGEPLFGLDRRMGVLINDPELKQGGNPLGPAIIGDAIMQSLKDQPVGNMKVKLLLVPALCKQLPPKVLELYQNINQHLIQAGILPTIRVGSRVGNGPEDDAKKDVLPPQSQTGTAGNQDIFATLQRLMGMGRIGAPVASGMADNAGLPLGGAGMAGAGPLAITPGHGTINFAGIPSEPPPAPVMLSLNHLQHGRLEEGGLSPQLFDPALLANGQHNVIRDLRNSSMAGSMRQLDSITLDIVAMVFDYILDDRRIPDALKALIGRLQIPVLKVAMLDKNFFSQKTHPARRLLDTMAAAAIGWDATEGHQGGLYRKMDELVQHILNDFDDKVEIFVEVLEDLEAYLGLEKQDADRLNSASASLIWSEEQAEIAEQLANDEVQSHLIGQDLPPVIRSFLTDVWAGLLASLHGKTEGDPGQTWDGAVETMEHLIWSIKPKQDSNDRSRMVSMLPGLLKRLDAGMTAMKLTKEERDKFFSALVKCHAIAINTHRSNLKDSVESLLNTPLNISAKKESKAAIFSGSLDFQEVPVPHIPVDVDVRLLREIAEPETAPPAPPEQVESRDGKPAPRLKRGSWIEFLQENGRWIRAKLTWVSPLRGIYLFTTRLGQRAITINATGLESKIEEGKARLIDDQPLVDAAVNNMLEQLQGNEPPVSANG